MPAVVDPVEQLDGGELARYLNEEVESYRTTIETRDDEVVRYVYEPLELHHPASRESHELTDYCETTREFTRCYDRAGGVGIDLPTSEVPADATLFDDLAVVVGLGDRGYLAARSATQDPTATRDSVFQYHPDNGRLVSILVAEPRHRIDFLDDSTTATTYYRHDRLLDRVMPAREFVVTERTTTHGLAGTHTRATFYLPYYDPDVTFADLAEFDVVAFPNPATDVLTLRPGADAVVRWVAIHDMAGRLIDERALASGGIDVSALAPGSYALTLVGDTDERFVTTFNKQ